MTADASAFSTDFAADFPATEAEWRAAAEAALKGRPLDQIARARLVDGLAFEAIRPRASARPIAGRAAGAPWTAMTRIDLADPAAANAQALEDLVNGASGLSLYLAAPGGGYGVVADTLDRLDATLEGVMLDLAPLHVEIPHFQGRTIAALITALVERRGHDPKDVSVLFGLDLMRDLTQTGTLSLPWAQMGVRSTTTVKALLDRGFASPVLMMDQRIAHDAGASEAQELAGALSSAVEHIRVLSANGLEASQIADTIAFAFACDADQFATIAKLRAARLLWAAIRREMGLDDKPIHIHAQTSRRMMSRKDAQSNIVRSTIAAFAAGVGGADSVLVLPHTLALGGADGDARRIARNAQSIVLEETNAYRVADPAAGAGAIEALTDALAERAWEIFRGFENKGGMFACVTSGVWQEAVKETRAKRARLVATRKVPIIGVSEFPKEGETPIAVPPDARPEPAPAGTGRVQIDETVEGFAAIVEAFLDGASTAAVSASWKAQPEASATPLELKRVAEPFERLREDNEARAARPSAYLATLGPVARHAARAGFIRNLLAAGGVEIVEGPVTTEIGEIVSALQGSGARLAVICGADADYAEGGPALAEALKGAGATVWLAGRPKDGQDALSLAGVSRFVAAGDDALEILSDATGIATARPMTPAGAAA